MAKEIRFFYDPDVRGTLPPAEAGHATRVLRLTSGDEIFLMDGRGCFYRAEITLAGKNVCDYQVVETLEQQRAWQGEIHLAIAPTKNIDRIEWMVEKATEIGWDSVTFLN
ncbi:MAG: RsmE family RNA methyltransferase, partial [Bacteroidaceae bacterium]|nr:RsmE family RNA methyltransferase [Bacteroidaceae bacterium]